MITRMLVFRTARPWVLTALALATALAAVACDAEMNFNPTAPTVPWWTGAGSGRDLQISGTLTADQRVLRQATVLYDGVEVPGARVSCAVGGGCESLGLSASLHTPAGHHTIAFQVLDGAGEAADYVAQGKVRVMREGLSFVWTIDLGPTRASLKAGESVSFDVAFDD